MAKEFTILGLMSGTSMDGIDVALIRSDGETVNRSELFAAFPYAHADRDLIATALGDAKTVSNRADRPGSLSKAEDLVTARHAGAIDSFLQENGLSDSDIDLIGFHGQTVLHRPEQQLTLQLGDGAGLARQVNIPVVSDLRASDMAHGGQGAPLASIYHAALAQQLPKRPVAFVNIGGVSNVTWIGQTGDLLAFDAGPGNALMDDWAQRHLGEPVDREGALARKGDPDAATLALYLKHPHFKDPAPKSLDRGDFDLGPIEDAGLSPTDGMATLAELTACAIAQASAWFPEPPLLWVVCGGGRLNHHLMALLKRHLKAPVRSAEDVGFNGDAIEAEAWAFLAARSLRKLPLTFPGTTGVAKPVTGGVLHRP